MRVVAWVLAAALCAPAAAWAQGRTGTASPGQQAFDDGLRAMNSDEFAEAERKFTECIGLDSSLTDCYWRLATIHYKNKKYAKAVELLRKAPEKTNLDVREQLGLNLYKTATPPPAEAIKLLEEVTAARASSFAAQLQLGQHFLRSDPPKAVVALEAYFKHRPSNLAQADDQIRNLLGTAYLLAKEWEQAVKLYEGLLKSKPNDLTAKLMLGTALVGKGATDPKACSQAITIYERILNEANRQPSIWFNLGTCYLRNNRAADAQRQAEYYTRAKGQDAKGHVLLGEAHFAQGRYDRALTSFQTARSLDKKNFTTLAKIGLTDVKLKNYDAAVAELEQAEAGDPNNIDVLCAQVEAYGAKRNKDKLQQKADKLAPLTKDARAQQCAGAAYWQSGQDEKAQAAFQGVLALEPNNGGAKKSLVRVLNRRASAGVEKGELAKAQNLLADAERLLPDELMTLRNLGLVLLLSKKYADAEVVLNKALKKVPNDIVVNRLLGRAALGLGKRDKAHEAYEKAAQTALRTRGIDLANVYTELGPLYVESGQLDQAVTVLEQAVREAGGGPLTMVAYRNLAIAYLERGRERLKDAAQAEGALDDISKAAQSQQGALSPKELTVAACYEAVAALGAGKISQAQDAIARAKKGGGCALKPPYDKVSVSFLEAYANYRDSSSTARREAGCKGFAQLASKVPGAVGEAIKTYQRSCLELAAYDYYRRGNEKAAEKSLREAGRIQAKGKEKVELDHNAAVLDMLLGRKAQAERALEALIAKTGWALVNLGILKDREGDGKAALAYYRRALERGVRYEKLREWIDVKQRLWGGQ